MARKDERGVVMPAPLQFNNPATAGHPRHDDENRGPAVADAYALSRCRIDLAEHAKTWPDPENFPPRMVEIAQGIPDAQRADWLRMQANLEEVDRLISYAMRSGDLRIWVKPIGEPELLVEASAMVEVDHATIVAGCYRPPNDGGWLKGRPLFVKRDDWVRFVQSINMAKTPGTEAHQWRAARPFTREDPADIAPWWSVNQALAWVVTRTRSFVQFVGQREADEPHKRSQVFVHFIVEQMAAESDEGRALLEAAAGTRPGASVFSLAGRALLDAIRAGYIQPAVREHGRSRIMAVHEFVGIGGTDTGSDWLDLDPQPLFSSAEMIMEFPYEEATSADVGMAATSLPADTHLPQTRSPAVKAGRPPSPEAIIAKADEMKARGLDTYKIASQMRHEEGFQHVATTEVRELIKGRWKATGRPKRKCR